MLNLIVWVGLGWLLLCVPSTIIMVRLFNLSDLQPDPSPSMSGQRSGARLPATPLPVARSRARRGATAVTTATTTNPARRLLDA